MKSGEEYLDAIVEKLNQGQKQWKRGDNLLAAFGYTRRRQTAIDWINAELEARGMYASPELTTVMPLDRAIRFRLIGNQDDDVSSSPESIPANVPTQVVEVATGDVQSLVAEKVTIAEEPPDVDGAAEMTLIVGDLECAERGAVCISPSSSVQEALTIMDLRDFSQLVVTSGSRDVRGIVSFKSVARAFLHGEPSTVQDCIDTTVPRVDLNEPLLRVVDLFQAHDVVLAMAANKTLSGIVTPADIAYEFRTMAGPFLLIGQIEERLRWLIKKANVPLNLAPQPIEIEATQGEVLRS